MKESRKYFHLYLFLVEFLGALCFYWGFFPASTSSDHFSTMDELPEIYNKEADNSLALKNHFDKCVIMIIDSLRYDFVEGKGNHIFFPYLSEQLNKNGSCLLKAKVQSPTVTLPRIKALLTGTIPGFLDVVSNFGKSELGSDNFITQANAKGYSTLFFGDETWINLLPHAFKRSEGTTSFFVSDYTEVDLNVTRNLDLELHKNDWQMMILHYLGLDHIGHLEGPRSKLIKPKLLEMDNIIYRINEHFLQKKKRVLIIVCGDHGMKDSGGHGGTSLSEILIPVAILNYGCDPMDDIEIGQIDLAPLISILLGLPIPFDSIGRLHYKILNGLDKYHALYALYYNSIRLIKKMTLYNLNETNLNDYISNSFDNAIKFYKNFLKTQSFSDYLNSAKFFDHVQEVISENLVNISVNYDLILMSFGMILCLQSLLASFFGSGFHCRCTFKMIFIITIVTIIIHCIFCHLANCSSGTCSSTAVNVISTVLTYFILLINVLFIKYSRKPFLLIDTALYQYFIAGTLLHVISLTSSSYIEEEHQFWYFLIVTLSLFLIKKDILGFSCLLICHRVLRSLNQTGDKWASLPDIEDWLLENNISYFLSFYAFSLLFTFVICGSLHSRTSLISNIFTIVQFVCIFFYKIVSGNIKITYFETNQHLAIVIARYFWAATLLKFIIFIKFLKSESYNVDFIVKTLMDFILELTIITISLLYKPHNLIIIPSLIIYSYIFTKNLKNDAISIIYLHNWLGSVFYFYQGNSNSISSIDVTSGYVGLETYNFYLTGLFVSLNTFSAPILSFLLMLRIFAKNGILLLSLAEIFHIHTLIYGLQIFIYSIMMTFQRHHLFIWSVFAPKLLYILSHMVLNLVLILITIGLIFTSKFLTNQLLTHKIWSNLKTLKGVLNLNKVIKNINKKE